MIVKGYPTIGDPNENFIAKLNRLTSYEKSKLQRNGLDITSRAVGGSVSTAIAGAVTGYSISSLINSNNISKDLYKVNLKNIFSNVSLVMLNLMRYYFLNANRIQPACVMAGIPMPSVSELSHALSDRILKYRATGGIFLAHQEGGDQSLRIVGKAWGVNRYWFLTVLDFLFLYGGSKVVDLFANAPTVSTLGIPTYNQQLQPSVDPWKEIEALNINEGRDEAHLTFPIITRTKIYTNMYIETYDFVESVENGMNCVEYSIFLRKYVPSYPYKYKWKENEFGSTVWYYSPDKDDELISKIRLIDLVMESGFSLAMIMYRFFQFLAGNSIETSIAYITSININTQNLGGDNTSEILAQMYDTLDYNLSELSISQKEELMQLD